MKWMIKYSAMWLMVGFMASCTVWDDSRDYVIPLPETDGTIGTDPWDGGQDDDGTLGH